MKVNKSIGRRSHKVSTRLLSGVSLGALIVLVSLSGTANAQDADRYWDANGTATGSGGNGNWNTIDPVWSEANSDVLGPYWAWNNAALDNAIFGVTAGGTTTTVGTVTLTAPITVHNMTFQRVNSWVISGDTLTLAGTTPTINTINSATINSIIAGINGLSKTGNGQLFLKGGNTFSGGITLGGGSLRVVNDAALGNASNDITTTANASFTIDTGSTSRTVTIGDGTTLTVSGAGTGSALYAGSGNISVISGVRLINDVNTYTGTTRLNGVSQGSGNVYFSSVRNLGEASSLGAPTTVANGTITFAGGSQYSDSIIYTGDGDSSNRNWVLSGSTGRVFRQRGTGTLTLAGDISLTNTSFVAETADFELLGVISGSGNVGFGASAAGSFTLGDANTFTGIAGVSGGVVRASVLADAGLASSLGMASTISLTNLGQLSYIGSGGSSNRTWSSDGATSILNDGTGALTLSGDLTFNAAGATDTLTLGGSFAGTNSFAGIISGTSNLASSGSGTWVLDGANTRTGTITMNGGTLQAGNASALGTTTGVTVNGGTLDLNDFSLTTPTLAGTGGSVALGGNPLTTLTVEGTASTNYGGGITGTGGLTKLGTSTLTLTGTNTYTGATNIGGGTLQLDFSPAGGAASNIISASSSLNMSGGTVAIVGAAGEANTQSFNGLNITAGANTISGTSGSGGSLTVNLGAITRAGGIVNFNLPTNGNFTTSNTSLGGWATVNGTGYAKVVGGNILALTSAEYVNQDDASLWANSQIISDASGAANTPYFGTVSGNVQIGGLQYTAEANSTVTIDAGKTLGVDGTIIIAPSVLATNQTITGGNLTGLSGAGGVLGVLNNGTGTFTITSTIVDNGAATGFTKGGQGTVSLTGVNSYSGMTTLSTGRLIVNSVGNGGVASAIGASSASSSNLRLAGGTLQYTGGTATTDRGFTLVNESAATPTIQVDGSANLTFTGQVTSPDDEGLIKTGTGTLSLNNATNNYVGATTISGGTLSTNALTNGGLASGIGAASVDSSNLVIQNSARLQYTGATTSTNRGFTLGIGGIDVTTAATTVTIGGAAVGTGGLTKLGDGTLILSGTNTYTGGTRVAAGTLRAGSTVAFGATNQLMTVDAAATLDLAGLNNTVGALSGSGSVTLGSATLTAHGNNGSFSGAISGPGGFIKGSSGAQTFVGCNNTYTGATTIQGLLVVDCLANGGVASGIGASSNASSSLVFGGSMLRYTGGTITTDRGFTLQSTGQIDVNNAATTLTFTGTVTGAGQLQKYGAGTLILTGNNNNSGGVNVQAGILRAGSATAFGTGSYTLVNRAGAVLDLNGFNMSATALSGGGAAGGNINLGSGTLTITTGGATYSGLITGTGGLVMTGAGTQALLGCDSSYTRGTTLNGGQLQVGCLANGGINSSIGASSNAASNLIVNNAVLNYVGAGNSTDRLMTIGGTAQILSSGTGAVNFTNTGAIVFANPNTAQTIRLGGTNTGDNRFALRLDNNGAGVTSFIKQDAGAWILTNSNSTYTGTTQILGGVLGVDKLSNGGVGSSIGASSNAAANLIIGAGSTLRYTGAGDSTDRRFTLAIGSIFIESSGTGAVNFTNNGAVSYNGTGARVMALGGTNAGDNIMGATIGNQTAANITSLAKNDSGKWILTGTNAYTGATNVNDGTLVIGNGGTAGSIVSSSINNAGVLGFNRSDTLTIGGDILGVGSVEQLGTGTAVLTGTNTYAGGTSIAQGTLQLGNGGTTGSIVGNVANNGALAFNRNNSYSFGGTISGTGAVRQIGTGTTILTGLNSYTGGTHITAGTLQVSSDANLGAASGGLALNGGTLQTTATMSASRAVTLTGTGTFLTEPATTLTLNGTVSGTGALRKLGAGTLTLAANTSYTGGTTISSGTLQIGNGGATGSLTGNVLNNGALVFNRTGTLAIVGTITGGGSVTQSGPGTTILTGANTYAGLTNINTGTLLVNGNQSGATALTSVALGATLGGTGTIGGDVSVADGATLAAGSNGVGALTINGNLSLGNASQINFEFGQANLPGGPLNDLVNVGGGLALDGVVNVAQSAGGNFGPGVYRMFNYGGTLTDNGLTIGTTPPGSDVFVQTAVTGQVNLANTAGLTLNFWDGTGQPKNDGAIQGGDGTWVLNGGLNDWTEVNGTINADYAQDSFAIFQGAGGIVTVDNSGGNVLSAGMQFTVNGYRITGDALTLTGTQAFMRTGDGSPIDDGVITTIDANVTGTAQLVKDMGGTLILSGTNSYTGGTAVNGGTLSIASNANLGGLAGGLSFSGGTLNTTATFGSNRTVDLIGTGTFLTDDGTALALGGTITGTGALIKDGDGLLVLTAANSFAGGTTITAGTLQLGDGGTSGSVLGNVANNGAFVFNRSDISVFAGTISGAGSVEQMGTGTTILTGANTYTDGTLVSAGILQLGNGGTSGGIAGDVVNHGTLAFNRSDDVTFTGLISGTGGVNQVGTGTTILTGSNNYKGATTVATGTLLVNADHSGATGLTSVASGATLGGTGTIGGNVTIATGGILAPGDATGPGTLAINGGLALTGGAALNYDFGQANVAGGAFNDLVNIGGDLTLAGMLNVTTSGGGSFDPGIYRVINYAGILTDNGLMIGSIPSNTDFYVQTSIARQVNLINTNGLALRFWDGGAGGRNDGIITGGDGVWQNVSGNDNWTLDDASINAPFLDSAFAIFGGASGTVTVDRDPGAINVAGMQFATDGYRIEGDALDLVGSQAIIRIGDGSAAGADYTATIVSELSGTAQLVKTDLGTLVLSGINTYTGGTAIDGGTLRISSDANLGAAAGSVSLDGGTLNTTTDINSGRVLALIGAGTLLTDGGTTLALSGSITGAGGFIKDGAGTLILAGANTYAGDTTVAAGSLFVNGDQSTATGLTSIASGAMLGGSGTIGGNVTLADGATLAAGTNDVGTLIVNGNLALSGGTMLDFEFGSANVSGGSLNDLVKVGGDLTLDGTINVSVPTGGTFGPGIYHAFNYGGILTDNGLALGAAPGGSALSVQTAVAGQVNLVNTAGLTLSFWDGAAGPKNDHTVNGSDGVWRVGGGSNNWTDLTGSVNADYAQDSFAIFSATPGTVSVDNVGGNVLASGIQFASDGYVITGGTLTLTGGQSIVQVGDGGAASAGYTATIDATIAGTAGLVKTDAGMLILTGTNSYMGGTTINAGMLRISGDANLGDAAGDLTFDGGTLNSAADINSSRTVNLVGAGTLLTDAGTTLTLNGAVSGTNRLTKSGAGTLALSGTGTYTGETHVDAGTLLVNGDYSNATGTTLVASGASLGGVGTIGGDVSLADSAVLTPGAGGTGTLGINGNLSLSSGTQLNYQFGEANTAGGALNDLVNIGGDLTLDGVINVSIPVGSAFDVGIYRVFNYGGKLTDNGLSLGTLPAGSSDITVQTSISGQVNLVNSAGLTLSLWDGAAGPKNNGIINGGDGVWQASSGNDNWTDSSGAVNAAYSDGAYAVFSATKGIVTVDNGTGAVSAAGMQFASDGYIITGDAVTLIGPQSVIRVGDGQSNSSGFTATINSALLGDTQVVKTDAGTLVLGGNNTYTGGTLIKGGTVQIAADSNLGAVTGGLSFNGGVLWTTADVTSARTADFTDEGTLLTDPDTTLILSGSLSGTGNLKKAGDGMVVLTADSSGYNGSGIVDAGTLAVNGALGGTLSVSGGGHLTGTGQVGATTNYGSISPGFSGEIGTLTIQGDYIGNNGHLDIAAALGDDSSAASRLVVTGAASGTTHVSVTNRGGMGGQTTAGIKIIDVTGASDGRFVLDGDYEFNGDQAVVAGAFGYRLYQGGVSNPADGDWYLRSGLLNPTDPTEPATPLYQPGVPLYEIYSQLLGTLDELPTLRQRVGDHYTDLMPATSDDQPGGTLFTWVRIVGGHGDFAPKSSATVSGYNADIEQIQGGFSAPVAEMETGRLVIEGTVHMGTTQSEMTSTYGDGAIDVTSYGFGGTVTWYGRDGIYLDGQGQYTGFVTDLYSRLLGYNVATAQKAYSLKAGIETGKVYRLNARWSLTPQAQFVYSTLSMDRFKDRFGAEVSPNQVDNLRGRIGFAVDYRNSWRSNTGRMSSISVYGLPNLYYEFLDPKTTVNISGTTLAYDIGRLSGGLALGVKFDGNDGGYSLYGEISGDTGLDGKGRSHMIKGNFGLRVRW